MSDPTLKYLARSGYRAPSVEMPAAAPPTLTGRRKRRLAAVCTELISHGKCPTVSDETAAAFHHFCALASAGMDRALVRNAVEEQLRGVEGISTPQPSIASAPSPLVEPMAARKVQYDWGKFLTRKRAPVKRYLPPRRLQPADEED